MSENQEKTYSEYLRDWHKKTVVKHLVEAMRKIKEKDEGK